MSMIIGIDEVGRGCWAGPLLVVAAKLKTDLPTGLADSKVLSKKQREALMDSIISNCCLGEGWVQPHEIDQLGLTVAMKVGVERALVALGADNADKIIIDGSFNYCHHRFTNVQCLISADAIEPIVSVASIYAKVSRDRYMTEQAVRYPNYGFEKHVGYGTAAHIAALKKWGICVLHRRSYKPIRAFVL